MQRNAFRRFATTDLPVLLSLKRIKETARKLTQADASDARRIISETAQALGVKLDPALLARIKSSLDYYIIRAEDPQMLTEFNAELYKRFGNDAPIYVSAIGVVGKLASVKPSRLAEDCKVSPRLDDIRKRAEHLTNGADQVAALVREFNSRTVSCSFAHHTCFSDKPTMMRENLGNIAVAGCKMTLNESGEVCFPSVFGARTAAIKTYAIFPDLLPSAAKLTADSLAARQAARDEKKKQAAEKRAEKKTKTEAKKTEKKNAEKSAAPTA